MTENTQQSGGEQSIDGFSDTQSETGVDSPDYGAQGRKKPMTEEEYLAAEREIKELGDHNRLKDREEPKKEA